MAIKALQIFHRFAIEQHITSFYHYIPKTCVLFQHTKIAFHFYGVQIRLFQFPFCDVGKLQRRKIKYLCAWRNCDCNRNRAFHFTVSRIVHFQGYCFPNRCSGTVKACSIKLQPPACGAFCPQIC